MPGGGDGFYSSDIRLCEISRGAVVPLYSSGMMYSRDWLSQEAVLWPELMGPVPWGPVHPTCRVSLWELECFLVRQQNFSALIRSAVLAARQMGLIYLLLDLFHPIVIVQVVSTE